MNPNNFQNMVAGLQQPQAPMQRQAQLPELLFNHYRRQQAPAGWQTSVPIQERVANAIQLVTALRLIQGAPGPQGVIQMATNFEMDTFVKAPSMEMYKAVIKQKLSDIKDKRQSIANVPGQQHHNNTMPQQRAGPQQMSMHGGMTHQPQNQNQFQQGVPHQYQQQMQPSPVTMQQPQIQPLPNSENTVYPPPPQDQPRQRPLQNTQQKAQLNLPTLTAEEMKQASTMAHEAMTKHTPESLEKLKANVPIMYRAQLAQSGIDPAYWMLQQQAARTLQILKSSQSRSQGGAQISAEVSSAELPGAPQAMNTLQSRPAQSDGPMSRQVQLGGVSTDTDSHISQYLAQQADASRLQDAGQLVVPASNNPITFQQQGQPGQARPGGTTHATPLQQQQQQQTQHPMATQHLNVQQARASAQAQMRPSGESQQAALRGQAGGLNGPHQGIQQSPAMSMLNRPMTQPGQQDTTLQTMEANRTAFANEHQGTSVNPRIPESMGQPAQAGSAGGGGASTQQLNIPPQFAQVLANIPMPARQHLMQNPAQLKSYMENLRRQQGLNAPHQTMPNMPLVPAQAGLVPPQMPQGTQHVQNQFIDGDHPHGSQTMHQIMHQAQTEMPSALPSQQAVHRPPPQQTSIGAMPAIVQQALNSMTPDIILKMDGKPFPPGLSNPLPSAMPASVRTWGDLKRWTQANATSLPPNAVERIRWQQALDYRRLFFEQHPQQQQQQHHATPQLPNRSNVVGPPVMGQPSGTAPQIHRVALGMSAQQAPSQQAQLQPHHMKAPDMSQGMPPIRPPSIQEIQRFRQTNNITANMTDDDIGQWLMSQKLQQLRQQQNQSAIGRAQPPPQQQPLTHPTQQNTFNTPQHMFIEQQQHQQPRLQQGKLPQATVTMQQNARDVQTTGISGMGQRTAHVQSNIDGSTSQPMQNLKRSMPGNDDVIEVPNPNLRLNQSNPTPTGQRPRAGPGRAGPTPEQIAAMNPRQRQQFQASLDAMRQSKIQNQDQGQNSAPQAAPLSQNVGGPASQPRQMMPQNSQRIARFGEILAEISKTSVRKPPLSLKSEEKQEITKQLGLVKEQLKTVDQAIRIFFTGNDTPKTEGVTRQMLLMRFLVNQQEKASATESYSTTVNELNQCLKNLWQFAQMVFKQYQDKHGRQQQQKQQEMASQRGSGQLETQQTGAVPLNTQQPQANFDSRQKHPQPATKATANNRDDSKPPAAPTTAHPPFHLGVPSPGGVPRYGSNELITADKLKLPPNKKQKVDPRTSAASTPFTPGPMASPVVIKQASPEIKKQPAQEPAKAVEPAKPTYKCPDTHCEASIKGFSREEDLEKHQKEMHPHIEDPLKYCLDAMAAALGLNTDGTVKKAAPKPASAANATKEEKSSSGTKATATAMQQSASKTGKTSALKAEATTPQPGAVSTPMSRVATVNSALKASPTVKDLKTPQQAAHLKASTPVSPTPAKQVLLGKTKPATPASSSTKAHVDQNPTHILHNDINHPNWNVSDVNADMIKQSFDGINGIDADIFSWLNDYRDDETEDSSPTDSTKSSESKKSDISATDVLDVKIDIAGVDVGIASWFDPVMDIDDPVAADLEGLEIDGPRDGDEEQNKKEKGQEQDKGRMGKKLPDPEDLKWDDVFGPNAGLDGFTVPGWPERDVLSVFDDLVRDGGMDALDDMLL